MGEVLPMPAVGDLFTDVRDGGRTMRVSYHDDQGVVVVSLWAGTVCRGSFRMAARELSKLISTLTEIELSVDYPATPGAVGLGSDITAGAGAPDRPGPPSEQTGDMARAANGRFRPPVYRVA